MKSSKRRVFLLSSIFMLKCLSKAGVALINAFGVNIGHKMCHRVLATSATFLSEGPKDQKSRCPASEQVISCPLALGSGRTVAFFLLCRVICCPTKMLRHLRHGSLGGRTCGK